MPPQQQLEQFDAQLYQHPEFSNRNNLTGDLLGHAGLDQLHRMDAFQWLDGQLAEHVSAYLRSLLGPDHGLMAHIQKAWPVVRARNGGTVDLHSHRNAQLSAVFYVLTDPANESGELEFEAPVRLPQPCDGDSQPRCGGFRWGVCAVTPPSSAVPFGPAPSGAPL